MFGRKPPSGAGDSAPSADRVAATPFQPAGPRPTPTAPARPVALGEGEAGLPSRPTAVPTPPTAPGGAPRRPAEPQREVRKLIVGREITLSGEIASCDHLIVEGTVEASVKDCHRLEVTEAGLFRGSVEISEAEIAGRFEGEITVHGRLSVRATGKVEGKVHYGELAVDAGGTLDGEVRGHSKPNKSKPVKPVQLAEAPLLDQTSPSSAAPAEPAAAEAPKAS